MQDSSYQDSTGSPLLNRFVQKQGVKVDKDLVYSAIKTEENRRMVFIKSYLHLYNAGVSLSKNDYSFEKMYRRLFPGGHLFDSLATMLVTNIGEPPVLVDTLRLREDMENIRSVYFSRGYFHPEIYYKIDTSHALINPQKAKVTFYIRENDAYIIDRIQYVHLYDSVIRSKILENTALLQGDNYNEDNIVRERNNVTQVMRNMGFFRFSLSDVEFEVDTLPISLRNTQPRDSRVTSFKPVQIKVILNDSVAGYHIGRVRLLVEPAEVRVTDVPYYIHPPDLTDSIRKELNLSRAVVSDDLYLDGLIYDRALPSINLNFLAKLISFRPGRSFSLDAEHRTLTQLQGLGIFKFVVINYTVDDSLHLVDVQIQTRLQNRYQAKVGVEGFTQNDPILQNQLPGVGGNILFRDKMVSRGGEKLSLSAKGYVSFYRPGPNEPLRTFYELGVTATYSVPRINLPGTGDLVAPRFQPSTNFSANLRTQQRREYSRTLFGLNWNYSWFHSSLNQKRRSSLSPYIINLISADLTPEFQADIANIEDETLRQFIALDFSSRFSSRFNYKYTFSDYGTTRLRTTHFLQPSFDFGGNTPYLIDRFAGLDSSYKDHALTSFNPILGTVNKTYYGQFVKASLEYKFMVPVGRKSEFVMRFFTGASDPWNYTTLTPFDARFFSGGTTSMRAWQSNTLGPGNFNTTTSNAGSSEFLYLISPGGECIFEANAEMRVNVHKYLELAFFSDVGNVWFLPNSRFDDPDGVLSATTATQLGWDAGLGFRLDFSFLIFRIDVAQQLYAPDIKRNVFTPLWDVLSPNRDNSLFNELWKGRQQINFGIGYPF
jgi:outer membrane protein assembly factor BamA